MAISARLKESRAWVPKKTINAEIAPDWFHSGQQESWADESRIVIDCAGTQGGKTACTPYWLLREIVRTAHIGNELGFANYIYGGPTMTLLDAQAIPGFLRVFVDEHQLGYFVKSPKPKFHLSVDGARRLGLNVPAVVHFAYLNDPQNVESMTALAAAIDEGGQKDCKVESYEAVERRLTIAKSRGFGRIKIATTPYVWDWLKTRLVDNKGTNGIGYHSWPSWANPLVDEAACRAELDNGMPSWRWEMMYEAKWTRPAGAIYDIYDDRVTNDETGKTNVCEPFDIPKEWPIYLGFDFGPANTSCTVLAYNERIDTYYAVANYKGGGEVGDHIRRVESLLDGRTVSMAFGGSSSEDSYREKYTVKGMPICEPFVTGADSVSVGIDAVYALLKKKKLIIFSTLTGLRGELVRYSFKLDANGEATNEIENKKDYHRADSLRYPCVSLIDRPELNITSRSKQHNDVEEDWDEFWQMPKSWTGKVDAG